MQFRWGNAAIDSFRVSNAVRQGGISSPLLLYLCMDDLPGQLSDYETGCVFGDLIINAFMYADDLFIMSSP